MMGTITDLDSLVKWCTADEAGRLGTPGLGMEGDLQERSAKLLGKPSQNAKSLTILPQYANPQCPRLMLSRKKKQNPQLTAVKTLSPSMLSKQTIPQPHHGDRGCHHLHLHAKPLPHSHLRSSQKIRSSTLFPHTTGLSCLKILFPTYLQHLHWHAQSI